MSEELDKIRMYIMFISVLFFLAAGILTLRGYFHDIWYFALMGTCAFLLGLVCFIFALLYPIIYKAEIMIDEMDEENKKNERK
ncbi:MAG: hypothetical protein K2J59_02375 [Eubacterium sp.]|nr:hypothetical protein [Eubacterium sp.]